MEFVKNLASSIYSNRVDAAISIGESALHTMSPDNYEYYMCSLELIDCQMNQIGFISFVVMPNNISESVSPIQTQVKTKGGLVTLFNDTFAPVNISIQGTFGRRFRLVTGVVNPADERQSGWGKFSNGNLGKVYGIETAYLSGYGLTKVMKYILERTTKLDSNGKPYVLIFNNYAFNTSYVVDVVNSTFSQSTDTNMLWYYDIQLKGIAPGESVRSAKTRNAQLLKTVASNAIAKGLSNIVKDVKRNNDFFFI